MTYDVIIRGGTIVDGSGAPRFRGDLGIRGDRIADVGDLAAASGRRLIDAAGLVVAPGFVDLHTHHDLGLMINPTDEPKIRQGVTTELVGLCGYSLAPLPAGAEEATRDLFANVFGRSPFPWDWATVGGYLKRLDGRTSGNVCTLIGFNNLRLAAVGPVRGPATPPQTARMQAWAAEAMADGAVGLSHGASVISTWSSHEEVVAVARTVGEHGGIYCSHMRSLPDDPDPLSPVREAIAVGEEAGLPVHILHFKTYGHREGHGAEMLALVDAARARGLDVTIESYPYTAGSGDLNVPDWAQEGGPAAIIARLKDPATRRQIVDELNQTDWTTSIIAGVASERNRWVEGKTVAELAGLTGKTPGDVVCDLLLEEDRIVQRVATHGGEDDMRLIMRHPYHMVGSDSIDFGSHVHPRTYGCYPRFLGRYVRDLGILSLETCIRKMTSQPAARLGLRDRGLIRAGYAADITAFNPDTVADRATFENSRQFSIGIEYVLVNGTVVVDHNTHTGALAGHALRPRSQRTCMGVAG